MIANWKPSMVSNTKIVQRCKHDKGEIMKQSIIDHNVLRAPSYDLQDILFSCQNTFMGVKEVQLLVYIQMQITQC